MARVMPFSNDCHIYTSNLDFSLDLLICISKQLFAHSIWISIRYFKLTISKIRFWFSPLNPLLPHFFPSLNSNSVLQVVHTKHLSHPWFLFLSHPIFSPSANPQSFILKIYPTSSPCLLLPLVPELHHVRPELYIHTSFLDGLLASNFATLDMTVHRTARIIHLKNMYQPLSSWMKILQWLPI